ncbi:hypothetical protein STA3757_17910 [Stanieria sp. NIES-3757]|nr:hypothetical protein STA3757_17910 [Stanieria sp. NIES-3757]
MSLIKLRYGFGARASEVDRSFEAMNYLLAIYWLLGLTTASLNNRNFIAKPIISTSINQDQKQHQVKIFFPIAPKLSQSFTDTQAVLRITNSLGVARFAIEQLIKGPTKLEKQVGLIAPIKLIGQSNCGENFKLSLTQGVAILQFCQTVLTGGVGDDARLTTSIQKTLSQFPTINQIILLNQDGGCLNDLKGDNSCQKNLP